MLDQTYNQVVRFIFAHGTEEIGAMLRQLPAVVARDLVQEISVAGDVHRYDLASQRAYYFERQGEGLAGWIWSEVHYHHEAGELIALVVASEAPLDEKLASSLYTLATGRQIDQVPDRTTTATVMGGAGRR